MIPTVFSSRLQPSLLENSDWVCPQVKDQPFNTNDTHETRSSVEKRPLLRWLEGTTVCGHAVAHTREVVEPFVETCGFRVVPSLDSPSELMVGLSNFLADLAGSNEMLSCWITEEYVVSCTVHAFSSGCPKCSPRPSQRLGAVLPTHRRANARNADLGRAKEGTHWGISTRGVISSLNMWWFL